MIKPMKRLCIDCSSPLNGRADKKFCDDQCRSNYNNKIRAESNSIVKSINLILKKNRDILERFSPNGNTKISSVKLMAAGFNPDYHTHTYQSPKGEDYVFCYEYGYTKLAQDDFLFIRKVNLLP
ncbi:hypothetical protein SAMN04488101_11674 [Pedobacter nyackensis]|uniref:DUF2116 family Zn-ribbon domain-containing protein n=2 Tax=Pedobacter nyackensis TaxID=475255 RepID=A0A1W2EVV6_9SPHI|nr:hypothetical protein SAMN04488101_11674 [Pedobacter nyackensis]